MAFGVKLFGGVCAINLKARFTLKTSHGSLETGITHGGFF